MVWNAEPRFLCPDPWAKHWSFTSEARKACVKTRFYGKMCKDLRLENSMHKTLSIPLCNNYTLRWDNSLWDFLFGFISKKGIINTTAFLAWKARYLPQLLWSPWERFHGRMVVGTSHYYCTCQLLRTLSLLLLLSTLFSYHCECVISGD